MIKRPLVWILAAYLVGMYLAWLKLPIIIVVIGMPIFYIAIYLFMYRIKNPWITPRDIFIWCMPFLLLLGCLAMKGQLKKPELYSAFDQEVNCELSGRITMVVQKQKGRAIYVHNNKIMISGEALYLCENVIVYSTDEQSYLVGNQITVQGTLQKFSKASNPGQFNEQLYYQIENIDFKMEADKINITDARYSKYHVILDNIKNKLITVYDSLLSDKEAGTLIAMLLGEKYLLDGEIKQLYQTNGISHILAISGLHVSLIGMFVFWLLKRMKIPITVATFLSIFFIYSYGVLTNFSVSTNRAIVMMVILFLASLPGKTYDMLSAMALSALLILLQNPLQLFSAGFLLSFGAVLGIAVIYPALKKLFPYKNALLNSLLISFSAQLATTPFILYFFYQFPTYSILTNLIVLPFVTILTLTAIFAGIVGAIYMPLGIFLIGGANYILKFYEGICRVGSSLPENLITVGKPDFLRMLLYGALLVAFLWLTKKYTKKVFLIIPCIGMLLILLPHSNVGLEVTFLDVGQGDGIYIETNNGTTYLIDGGSSDISKVGLYRLQPFLLSQGTDRIDYAIMSHSDNDHINGLKELMDHSKIKIKHLVLPYLNQKDEAYKEFEQLAKNSGVMLQYIRAGDSLLDGNIRMICLHPSSNYIAPSANAYSTVLSISYGEFDLLLTGDLQVDGEKKVEEILKTPSFWGQYGMNPPKNYEVLKVAHHGSRYSTMEEFLSMINPKYSIISCGENNTYGHPHEELLARLKEIGSRRLITYETGAITIKTDGVRLEMTQFR